LRVLCLTRYDAAGPSSRYRTYQYVPHLRSAGVDVELAPLLDGRYVANLYEGRGQRALDLLAAAMRRVWRLRRARLYDVVWIEKELFPFLPPILEYALRWSGARLVLDYDDATFHRYDQHRSGLVRAVLGRKLDRIMASATLVVAGNDYLAGRARAAGARAVEVLPTVIDLARYPLRRQETANARLTIGWIGSPGTQGYLRAISDALAAFCDESGARFVAVGANSRLSLPGVPLEVVPWTSEGEVRALERLDVGIMPLPDSPFERGKCGLKLIQYMGCALPVIASPVGANQRIVAQHETGVLASDHREWLAALRLLGASSELRARMGAAGRARAEAQYSLQAAAPRLLELLTQVTAIDTSRH
jgi:glycosyltransferase involved in cell wall biosynthesis